MVTPAEAEDILRSFYGLPPRGAAQETERDEAKFTAPEGMLDLSAFL